MGDIFEIFDHFWSISNNKAISIDIITVFLLGLAYWKFKVARHPRFRYRIVYIAILILLNINIYLFKLATFQLLHIYFYVFELLAVLYIITSAYMPILTFFPLKRLKSLIKGGFNKKSNLYFHVMKYITITTASKLEYKLLLSDDYANRHLYIKAYNELYNFNQRLLFESEKNDLEIYMAYYSVMLGDLRLAKTHLSRINKQTPLSLLVEMTICDISGGTSEQVLAYLEEAKNILLPQTPNALKAQIYANYGNCRAIQGNFEDGLFNVKKALSFAQKAKNETILYNIYEQLITLICYNDPNEESALAYFKEYMDVLNLNEPSVIIRSYNFISKVYRLKNMESMMLFILPNGYSAMIRTLSGCERYNWEVSNLEVAQNSGIHIKNIMNDVMYDFPEFDKVKMPDRFFLIKRLYGVLDHFFANKTSTSPYKEYRRIFNQCESYIATKAFDDLHGYYDALDINQIYERCEILNALVATSAMREWHNKSCVIRYDKMLGQAYSYENSDIFNTKSDHKKRIRILENIADIYNNCELKIRAIDAYINIVEECYSIYWLSDNSKFEINIIDKTNMEKYLKIAIDKMEEISNKNRFQSQYIKISAYYCILGNYDKALSYYKLFDKKNLKNYNMQFNNYFTFVNKVLGS